LLKGSDRLLPLSFCVKQPEFDVSAIASQPVD
jgi:hypothetical protein